MMANGHDSAEIPQMDTCRSKSIFQPLRTGHDRVDRRGEEERKKTLERNLAQTYAAKKASCPLRARCLDDSPNTVSVNFHDVLGRRTSIALFNVEAYPITLTQTPETGHVDGSMMNKYIAAFILLDETKSLLVIKPLHDSFCHRADLLSARLFHLLPKYRSPYGKGHFFDKAFDLRNNRSIVARCILRSGN